MIAKITRGSRAAHLAAYLHGPGRTEEHVYALRPGGAVIGGTLAVEGQRDGAEWAAAFADAAAVRPEIVRPVWQASLRNAPTDRVLSDAEWADAAQTFAERMGFAEHPWVVVRHGQDHVHVALSRVSFDGEVWHGRRDYRSAQAACAALEVELGLVRAPRQSVPVAEHVSQRVAERTAQQAPALVTGQVSGQVAAQGAGHTAGQPVTAAQRVADRALTAGEWRRAARTAVVPEKVVLAARVRAAAEAAQGQGRVGFERALERTGVEHRINVASTGRVSGYSVHLPGHKDSSGAPVWFKASQLDRGLSWTQVAPVLEGPAPTPSVEVFKRKPLELPRSYRARVAAADAASRVSEAPHVAAVQERAAAAWWVARRRADEAAVVAREAARRRASEPAAAQATVQPVAAAAVVKLNAAQIAAQSFPTPFTAETLHQRRVQEAEQAARLAARHAAEEVGLTAEQVAVLRARRATQELLRQHSAPTQALGHDRGYSQGLGR